MTSKPKQIKNPILGPDYAYFIGALLGDGCILWSNKYDRPNAVHCGANDTEMLAEFERIGMEQFGLIDHVRMVSPGPYHKGEIRYTKPFYTIQFYSIKMAKLLWDETRGKTTVPDWIKNSDIDTKCAFIRGFADAEGSVRKDGNSITIAQSEREILENVSMFLTEVEIKNKIYKASRGEYSLYICGKCNLARYVTKIGFKIVRKMDRLRKHNVYLSNSDFQGDPHHHYNIQSTTGGRTNYD